MKIYDIIIIVIFFVNCNRHNAVELINLFFLFECLFFCILPRWHLPSAVAISLVIKTLAAYRT